MTPPSDQDGLPGLVRAHPDAATAIMVVLAVVLVGVAVLAIFLFLSGRAWERLYELSELRRERGYAAWRETFGAPFVAGVAYSAPETRRQRRARKLINLAAATDNAHERESAVRIAEEISARASPVVK